MSKKMRILVTGGAGYIGSHTVIDLLCSGYDKITVIDDLSSGLKRNVPVGVKFFEGDFSDTKVLDSVFEDKYDAVIHFAASKSAPESVINPLKYYNNNLTKSIKFLKRCQKENIKFFIFSSTAAVYGDVRNYPITEEFDTKPTNPYGWSKLMFEQVLEDISSICTLKYVSLRYFNAGGAHPSGVLGNDHQKGEDVISVLMRVAKNKEVFPINGTDYDTEDGTCIRDIIHVSDLAKAHVLSLDYLKLGGSSDIFNLGSEKGYSIREIVKMTKEITGKDFKVIEGPRRIGDIVISIASSSKAKKTLRWTSKYSLRDIIETSWFWEAAHKKDPINWITVRECFENEKKSKG